MNTVVNIMLQMWTQPTEQVVGIGIVKLTLIQR